MSAGRVDIPTALDNAAVSFPRPTSQSQPACAFNPETLAQTVAVL